MASLAIVIVAAFFHASYGYKQITTKANFTDGNAKCQATYGTDLASIHSYADFEDAVSVCGTSSPCWLGGVGTQNGNSVNWVWNDGSSWSYSYWGTFSGVAQGEGLTNEYYTCIWSVWYGNNDEGVNDCAGTEEYYSVCNDPPTPEPTTDPACTDNPVSICPGTSFACSCDTCYGCDPDGVACNCYNCGCYSKCCTDSPTTPAPVTPAPTTPAPTTPAPTTPEPTTCTDNPVSTCPGTSFACSCDTCYGCDPNGVACNCYNCGCYSKCCTDSPTTEPTMNPTDDDLFPSNAWMYSNWMVFMVICFVVIFSN